MLKILLTPALSLGMLGLVFAAILAYASKKFAVPQDERIEKISELLPQANCGACGYPGCSGYAEAIVNENAKINLCTPGGQEVINKIAEIMGVTAETTTPFIARLLCGGGTKAKNKFEYTGINDCEAAALVMNGPKECKYGCIGFGTCARVCPFDAIIMDENNLPRIIPEKCTGCGKCVEICPQNVLTLSPVDKYVFVQCSSEDKGAICRKYCEVSCIGCKKCEKVCPFDAIKVENNVAKIDFEKCRNCQLCVENCPTKCITSLLTAKRVAVIDPDLCVGCTLCMKVCPVNAIAGEKKQPHTIDEEKCIGCSLCIEKCRKNAIILKEKEKV